MKTVHAYAALKAGEPLKPYEYTLGELGPNQGDVKVEYCGICHSDLSMINNDWSVSTFPRVPGHEIVGIVEKVGEHVTNVKVG